MNARERPSQVARGALSHDLPDDHHRTPGRRAWWMMPSMTISPDQQPWTNIRSVSTTSSPGGGKIRRPRRAQTSRRRQATPHRLASRYGVHTPVTMTLTVRTGADIWMEVLTDQGRFYVAFDASVFALVEQVIRGGHMVEELSAQLGLTHRQGVSELTRRRGPSTT